MGGLRLTEPASVKIMLFGDGEWAVRSLTALLEGPHRVIGIVLRARPTDDKLELAGRAAGIAILRPERVNAPEFVAAVATLGPDLCLSIAFDQVVGPALLATPPRGFLNCHAGMLPYYRGRNVINWAILNGEERIGLTAHFMDEGVDTGDILLQRELPVGWTDSYGTVLDRVVEQMPSLVLEAVGAIANGRSARIPQAHLPGTYFGGRGPGDEWLDWSDTSRRLHNKIRAISHPGPGARTVCGDETVHVWSAYYDPEWPTYIATPGQVVGVKRDEGVLVKTGDSTILLRSVQRPGRPAGVPRWSIGTRLGLNVLALLHGLHGQSAS